MRKLYLISLFVIILPAVLFVLSGCMKTPEPNRDFGPQISAEEVLKAFQTLPRKSEDSSKKGEFAYREQNLRIEHLPAEITMQVAETVVDRTETASAVTIVIETETKNFISNQPPSKNQSRKVFTKNLTPNQLIESTATSPENELDPLSFINKQIQAKADSPNTSLTLHNLVLTPILIRQPLLSIMEPNCAGFAPEKCNQALEAMKFSFDQVDWSGQEPVKTRVLAIYSSELPYLANPIVQCVSSAQKYGKQWANQLECLEVKNLRFGHD